MKKFALVMSLWLLPFVTLAQLPGFDIGDLDPAMLEQISNFTQGGSANPFSAANLPEFNQEVSIRTSPRFPEPNSSATVSLDDYSVETGGAVITWFVDGVEKVDAKNQRSFTIETKGLGETTAIRVLLTLNNGATLSQDIVINPARVDLILEPNTLTPTFYPGRPLPSVGSKTRVVALPQTGSGQNPSDFSYIWKLDNKVLFGGTLKGVNVATFEVGLGRNQVFSVDVLDRNGKMVAHKAIVVPVTEPELHFYAENPLRGLVPRSITEPYMLTSNEVTVRAEPYYVDRELMDNNPYIKWTINGLPNDNPSLDPQNITLRRSAGAGKTTVGFEVRNIQQLVQSVKDSFVIQF